MSNNGIFQIIVHGVQIPFSFYQLSSDINQLNITFTDTSGNTKNSIVVFTPGNYTALSILDELKQELIVEAQTPLGLYTGFTPTLDFQYDTTNFKARLAMTNPPLASIDIKFSQNTKIGIFFGFDVDALISTTNTSVGTKIMLTNPVSYLLLRNSSLKQFRNTEFIVEKNVFSDIVYKIPIYTNTNTWIQYNQPSEPIYIVNNDITTFNFYLTTNLSYAPIDLQGIDWSFSFTIREVERTTYTDKVLAQNVLKQSPLPLENNEELNKTLEELERLKQENLRKLQKYQKKLTKDKEK